MLARTNTAEPSFFAKSPYFLPCLMLTAAVMLAYVNSINNAFLFDDQLLIIINDYMKGWGTLGKLLTGSTISGAHIVGGFYRPLQMLLYFLIYQATGPVPFGFHILNIALHAVNACLLFALGRKLKFNDGASFIAALVWALHPIHTEAVTYISGTADPLAAFFCLMGLLVLFPDFAQKRFWYAIPFMLLALLSKEGAVAFPLLAMVCLYYVSPKPLNPKTYLPTWPLWIIVGVFVYWRATAPGFDGPQRFGELYKLHEFYNLSLYAEHPLMRFYTFLATLPAYLGLLLAPHDLHMERDFDVFVAPWSWMVFAGAAMLIASMGTVISAGKQTKPLGFGLFWFFAAHAPDTGLLIPMNALFLEHWMYMPAMGLFLGLGQTIHLALDDKRLRKIAAIMALVGALSLGALTVIQNTLWHDEITFYTYLFKFGTGSARTHNNLANAYLAAGEYEKAVAEYKRALELGDTYAEIHHNLGIAYLHLPDQQAHMKDAIDEFKRATEIDPNFFRSYGMLAEIYKFLGDADKSAYYSAQMEAAKKVEAP